jgi:hypothetical protein
VTARSTALYTALSLLIGCGSYRSQYARQSAQAGELVWRFDDDRLQVTRDGQLVAQAGAWEGLASAVACVPVARDWAARATARHHSGTVMLWTGTIGAIASTVGGVALVVNDPDSETQVIGGLGLALGGLIAGVVLVATGGYRRASAEARGVDAINLYNDQRALGMGCTSAPASAERVIR